MSEKYKSYELFARYARPLVALRKSAVEQRVRFEDEIDDDAIVFFADDGTELYRVVFFAKAGRTAAAR